ncbi:amidophosphoribosyltransferase [Candidatus Woesearchaeota archaeon]|nr:amidophosphoribosyltransferase [Candidatus Woesearchaeota archaeon]
MKEACGVFGVSGDPTAAYTTTAGLYALQHRGEESCGVATLHDGQIKVNKYMGLVHPHRKLLRQMHGEYAIGHVRYSTTGSSTIENAQPLVFPSRKFGTFALAHNGNLTNSKTLRDSIEAKGGVFLTTTDTEIIGHLLHRSSAESLEGALSDALSQVEGAYCLVLLTQQGVYAARDRYGFLPLVIGAKENAMIAASETCALDAVEADYCREVLPGEIVRLGRANRIDTVGRLQKTMVHQEGTVTTQPHPSHCLFEHVYFGRPDSVLFGKSIAQVRKAFGRQLAREHPVSADSVVPVPDSGIDAALGYAEQSKITYGRAFVRSHYGVGRTFIQPEQAQRDFAAKLKLSVIRAEVQGRRLVVVDDSIVRGTSSKKIVKKLRKAGAAEIHLRISCPPHKAPCYYGKNFPTKAELIANRMTVDETCAFIGADSLKYLSLEGMLACEQELQHSFCTACWTGQYPTKLTDKEKSR